MINWLEVEEQNRHYGSLFQMTLQSLVRRLSRPESTLWKLKITELLDHGRVLKAWCMFCSNFSATHQSPSSLATRWQRITGRTHVKQKYKQWGTEALCCYWGMPPKRFHNVDSQKLTNPANRPSGGLIVCPFSSLKRLLRLLLTWEMIMNYGWWGEWIVFLLGSQSLPRLLFTL